MIKKIYKLIMVMLFVTAVTQAQTLSVVVDDVEKPAGNIEVPLYFNGFTGSNSISSITLILSYEGNLLDFTGIDINPSLPSFASGWQINTTIQGEAHLSYSAPAGAFYDCDGKMLDLKFEYSGGFYTDIVIETLEVSHGIAPINGIGINNGSVSQETPTDGTITISSASAFAGNDVAIPVNVSGSAFSDMTSLTLLIEYNPTNLTYVSVSNSQLGAGMVSDANEGILTITWNGVSVNFSGGEDIFDLNFVYNGGGTAALTFMPGCEVSNSALELQSVSFTDGEISAQTDPVTVTLGNETALLEEDVTVPVTLAGGPAGITSITQKIGYDAKKLSYLSTTTGTLTGITAAAVNGVLTITWTDNANTVSLDGKLFDINFKYNGIGSSALTFEPGCEITAGLTLVNASYIDGSVAQATPFEGKVTIANVAAYQNQEVDVPITFSDFPVDAGSVQLKLKRDQSKLAFTGFTSSISGATCASVGETVTFTWSNTTPIDLNSQTLTLHFTYNAVTMCPIQFSSGTQIGDASFNVLNTEYVDGSVGQPITVSTKVFLQGPYVGSGLMNTVLATKAYFPKVQPYKPWGYDGIESVASIPADVVDWILVELRSDETTMVAQRAGFLLSDGSVVDLDGVSPLAFGDGLVAGDYYIVIKHRNHLAIMSAVAQPLSGASVLYDFTTGIGQAFVNGGTAMLLTSDNRPAMILGDVNGDKVSRAGGPPNLNDKTLLTSHTGIGILSEYSGYDVNMDGFARSSGPPQFNDAFRLTSTLGITIYSSQVP